MIKKCDLTEVSDGKTYGLNDMVAIGCGDCAGCSACCRQMGDSIWLDPLDVAQLCSNLDTSSEELLGSALELQVQNGVILPNLKLTEESGCVFLSEAGRCTIHSFRPGLCRLFPLGRIYTEDSILYVLLTNVCRKESGRVKMKVSKWLDTPELKDNQKFLLHWYQFLTKAQQKALSVDEDSRKKLCLGILSELYQKPYQSNEKLYTQLEERLNKMEQSM